jgi:SOS-response transcriptional repressor LexA
MAIKDWVLAARTHAKLTQEQFGEAMGMTKGNVSAYENGRHEPSWSQMIKMSEVTGYPLPLDRAVAGNTAEVKTKGHLPLISWVQAGTWSEIVDNFNPGDAEEWIPTPFSHGDGAFILRVQGESNYNPGGEKSYSDRDFIAVDPSTEPRNKKMVVVKVPGQEQATFKQLLIEPDGTWLLQALNPNWSPRIMPFPENAQIVGVVIGKWSPE